MRSTRFTAAAQSGALLGALCVAVLSCSADPAADATQLSTDTFASWQTYVEPDTDELAFQRIPWLATYVDGVIRADTEKKPLLLWIMNGHPLGCT